MKRFVGGFVLSPQNARTPQSSDAAIYLAYIAKFLGDQVSEQKLFAVVDRLTPLGRFNDGAQTKIRTLVSSQGTTATKEAIALLCSTHLK